MNITSPIYWHEGLYLKPQHFQRADGYNQTLAFGYIQLAIPYPWGVKHVKLNLGQLSAGIVYLENLDVVFQDGCRAILSENSTTPARRILAEDFDEKDTLKIYVALRKSGERDIVRDNNIDKYKKNESTNLLFDASRCLSDRNQVEALDLSGIGAVSNIKHLTYNILLLKEHEIYEAVDFDVVQIASITKQGNTYFQADDSVPPLLDITKYESLRKRLNDLIAYIKSYLQMFRSNKVKRYDKDRADIILVYQSLYRWYGQLEMCKNNSSLGSYGLYMLLMGFLVDMEAFKSIRVPGVADVFSYAVEYDHSAPSESLNYLFKRIPELIQDICKGPVLSITMKYDGTYYLAELGNSELECMGEWYLRVALGDETEDIRKKIVSCAKISAKEHVPLLIANSLPGLRLSVSDMDNSMRPMPIGMALFKVEKDDETWPYVGRYKNLAVYLGDDIRVDEIRLEIYDD